MARNWLKEVGDEGPGPFMTLLLDKGTEFLRPLGSCKLQLLLFGSTIS